MTKHWLAALLLGPCVCGIVQADSVTLTAGRDNCIYSVSDERSNGRGSLFVGTTGEGSIRRALVFFDVAGAVPDGATLTRVSLTLSLIRASDGGGAQQQALHRLLDDWGEGDSLSDGGSGAEASEDDATWAYRFFPDDARVWQAPGGDFEPTASAVQSVGVSLGPVSWDDTGLVADVQLWLDDPLQNFGWILVGNESANNTSRRFDSREVKSGETRPTLVIEFDPPANGDSTPDDGDPGTIEPPSLCGPSPAASMALAGLLGGLCLAGRGRDRRGS